MHHHGRLRSRLVVKHCHELALDSCAREVGDEMMKVLAKLWVALAFESCLEGLLGHGTELV